jgi:hypothetical protein
MPGVAPGLTRPPPGAGGTRARSLPGPALTFATGWAPSRSLPGDHPHACRARLRLAADLGGHRGEVGATTSPDTSVSCAPIFRPRERAPSQGHERLAQHAGRDADHPWRRTGGPKEQGRCAGVGVRSPGHSDQDHRRYPGTASAVCSVGVPVVGGGAGPAGGQGHPVRGLRPERRAPRRRAVRGRHQVAARPRPGTWSGWGTGAAGRLRAPGSGCNCPRRVPPPGAGCARTHVPQCSSCGRDGRHGGSECRTPHRRVRLRDVSPNAYLW